MGASAWTAWIAALDLVGARPVSLEAAAHERLPLGNPSAVPARALLVREQHELAARVDARCAPRIDQQHQREQPRHLRLVGRELEQVPAEPDRLGAEVVAHELSAAA